MDSKPNEPPKPPVTNHPAPVVSDARNVVIAYDTDVRDITNFVRHTCRKTLRNQEYYTIAMVGIMVFGVSVSLGADVIGIICSLIGAISVATVFGTLYHFIRRYFIRRGVEKIYRPGSSNGVLGRKELELDGGNLIGRTQVSESRFVLSAIDRIEETEGYIFVYLTAVDGFVIPKDAIVVGDACQFLKELRRAVSDARK